jgi:hypothetical protein
VKGDENKMDYDLDKWMKENGIEDVTGDKEAELEASINTESFFLVENDHEAILAICSILNAMRHEMKYGQSQYFDIHIGQRLHYLRKYLST